jgi:hypothetical protein
MHGDLPISSVARVVNTQLIVPIDRIPIRIAEPQKWMFVHSNVRPYLQPS